MFYIYFADMAKATKRSEYKKRPVVVVEDNGNTVKVFNITSRMKDGEKYVHMNNYKIYGYCNTGKLFTISKKFLKNFVRSCTTSEQEEIISHLKTIG